MPENITIDVKTITESALDGKGIFDVLMQSTTAHLQSQYAQNYISQAEYSNIYVQLTSQCLQQAMQFALGKDTAEKQAELLARQALMVEEQTKGVIVETANAEKQGLILDKQLIKMDSEIALAESQVRLSNKQEEMLDKQMEIADADILLKGKQLTKMDSEIELIASQVRLSSKQEEVMDSEIILGKKKIEKITEDILLTREQVNQAIETTKNIIQNTTNAVEQQQVIKNSADKVKADAQGSYWKAATEQAQTNDTYKHKDTGLDIPVAGAIGRKLALYEQQEKGFKQDGMNKALKVLSDTWSVAYAQNPIASLYPKFLGTDLDVMTNAVNKFVVESGLQD